MIKEKPDFEIIECICSWYDLLGFGQPLMDSHWNLNDKRCEEQLNRIKTLDLTYVNRFSSAHRTTSFSLNDGIILNFDINSNKLNFKEQLVMVFDDLLLEYESLNDRDVDRGNPGVRGIITLGHRYNYTYAESTITVADNFTTAYHPKVFQMNTAFSKAYIMENSGSRAGISGNNLFVDKYLLNRIEELILIENEGQNIFRIEKNLIDNQENMFFSIFRNDDIWLKLVFDRELIEYNYKGIITTLYKFISRESRQDTLANEAAFLEGQRYAQMEIDEYQDEE